MQADAQLDIAAILGEQVLQLSGVGDAAAQSLAAARETGGEYISIDDLQARSKVSKTVIEMLQQAGALKGLPESSQMTMF